MIDEMAIYLKALDFQGLFRILGAKNIFHFYGCKISTSETRTSDLLPKIRANQAIMRSMSKHLRPELQLALLVTIKKL